MRPDLLFIQWLLFIPAAITLVQKYTKKKKKKKITH